MNTRSDQEVAAADSESRHQPLLTVRTALIFLLATLSGIGAGLLVLATDRSIAESIMAGCGAAAAGLMLFNQLIAGE